MIADDLKKILTRVEALEQKHLENPTFSAWDVLVAAELLCMDMDSRGEQPSRRSLDRLQAAVNHWKTTIKA